MITLYIYYIPRKVGGKYICVYTLYRVMVWSGWGSSVSAGTDNGFGLHPAKMNYLTLDDWCAWGQSRGGTLKTPEAR